MAKRVAVIGAGASGITAIKCCLDEGLQPVCFEQTDYIGGLWHYTEKVEEDVACVMKSTVINTSKEMMCYSDFPIPASFPNFMHNTKVLEYFNLYVDKFDLKTYIRFNTKVLQIKPAPDFDTTGRWEIETQGKSHSEPQTEIYDAVLLCSGHHASKNMPSFPGRDDFGGKQVHTHDYRNHMGYEDKRVLVVGIGNSGGDVAVELSKIAKQVYLSTRRGSWIFNRVSDGGRPFDLALQRRFIAMIQDAMPRPVKNYLAQSKLNERFDHADFGLKPDHGFDAQHPTVNDELPNRIASGTIIVKPNVEKITRTGVEFDNGTFEDDIDVIIYATGYQFGLPYVSHPGFAVTNNTPHLYKYMFAPDAKHQTMAAIGFFQPLGAIMPISETQCRLATRVFKGLVELPSQEKMRQEIERKHASMTERYVTSPRHTIQVDWIQFMDELSELIGCKPDILSLLFKDPQLGMNVLFGPCSPYQFRLSGPGVWEGARQAIMTQWDRAAQPLQTRPVTRDSNAFNVKRFVVVFVIVAWLLNWILSVLM